jgi:hypothetical protein
MGCLSRRSFLTWLFSWVAPPILHPIGGRSPIPHGPLIGVQAGTRGSGGIAHDFVGEELSYRMSIVWINQAAIGRISFEEVQRGQLWRATLEGKATGIIGWFTRYRKDTYTSYMESIDGGRRLRPLRFEEDIVVGGKIRSKITHFDYRRGKLIKRRMNREGIFIQTEGGIPAGVIYDDFLTAFYNFRSGVYGKIQRGRRYRVRTLPKAEISTIEVEIVTKEEEMRMRRGQSNGGDREYYVTVFLDKEITKSRTGKVKGWLSKNLIPIEGTIEDVVFFGDVHGFLIGERRTS